MFGMIICLVGALISLGLLVHVESIESISAANKTAIGFHWVVIAIFVVLEFPYVMTLTYNKDFQKSTGLVSKTRLECVTRPTNWTNQIVVHSSFDGSKTYVLGEKGGK